MLHQDSSDQLPTPNYVSVSWYQRLDIPFVYHLLRQRNKSFPPPLIGRIAISHHQPHIKRTKYLVHPKFPQRRSRRHGPNVRSQLPRAVVRPLSVLGSGRCGCVLELHIDPPVPRIIPEGIGRQQGPNLRMKEHHLVEEWFSVERIELTVDVHRHHFLRVPHPLRKCAPSGSRRARYTSTADNDMVEFEFQKFKK